MRITLIPILIMISWTLSFSNDSIEYKTNLLGIQTGYGNVRCFYPLESEKINEGRYIPLNIVWSTFSKKHYDEFSFSFANVKLKSANNTDVDLTDIKANCFHLSYGYYRGILKPEKFQLYGGAKINGYLSLRDVSYTFISPVNTTQYYKNNDLFIALDISLASKIKLGENLLLTNINNSILSFVTNRKYIIDQEAESDLLFFPQFKSFSFSANYYHKITSNIYLSAGYQFYYYSFPRSRDVLITEGGHSQLLTGIYMKF